MSISIMILEGVNHAVL